MTPELQQTSLLTKEIRSDQGNLWSIMSPRNLAKKTLVMEISLMINGGRLVSTGRGDLVKKMK